MKKEFFLFMLLMISIAAALDFGSYVLSEHVRSIQIENQKMTKLKQSL